MPHSLAPQSTIEPRSERVRSISAERSLTGALPTEKLLRAAARGLDRSHRVSGSETGERAIQVWEGLLRGRYTLVDWFDANGRRFIIAKRHPATGGVRRGLTKRERQVVMSAALGESSKVTGYRLGISPSRVSSLLRAAMSKLGVRTKAQLVVMVRVLNVPQGSVLPARPIRVSHNA